MGCITSSLLLLLVGAVIIIAMQGLFYPWSFYLGGHFHWLPMWSGIGTMHTPAGDYVLHFTIEPSGGSRLYNLPNFRGNGFLCTPRGERYRLKLFAGMNEKTGIDTNGKAMRMELRYRPWYWSFSGNRKLEQPRLAFRGKWQNPDLVMDDGGTLLGAFNADGTLKNAPYNYYHADAASKQQIVIHEATGLQALWADCDTK
jgi:hypothetical protein